MAEPASGSSKPNIVYVFADQMRASALGCAGNHQLHTPNIDALASESTVLTNAVSGFPLCGPYRAMFLTGRYGQSTGVVSNMIPIRTKETTIATELKTYGYDTAYIGKWHLEGQNHPYIPKERHQGFDYWVSENCNHNYFDTPACFNGDPEIKTLEGYQPDAHTDLAIEYIGTHRSAPFLLCLSWGPPHVPCVAPEEYMRMYDAGAIEQRPNVRGDHRSQIAGYYAQISNLDYNIGRLTKAISDAGIEDNTIFVFTSDHGDMLGSHGQQQKQRPWEESIHVPFILRYPAGLSAGRECDVVLNTADVMPTLLGLVGARVPEAVQGLDLSRFLLGETTGAPESVFLQDILPCYQAVRTGISEWRGVRTKRHTYARRRDTGWVLYDNEADPYQLSNLIDKPEARTLQKRLEDELHGWLERTGDDFASREEWKRRMKAATGIDGARFD